MSRFSFATMPMRWRYALVGGIMFIGALRAIWTWYPQNTDGLIRFRAKGDVAYGYGRTDSTSEATVKAFIRDNPQVKTLVLRNMPGTRDADRNVRIARFIRREGLNTHLERRSFIASGAVDLFLAGNRRTMECGARIGVHSWSSILGYNPRNTGRDDRQKFHEKFLRDMGIDERFYVFTREAAGPDDLHILTMDEIRRFDLLTEYPDCD